MVRPAGQAGALSSATASSATPRRVRRQVERQDVLAAGLGDVPAVRRGVGADLGLVAVDDHRPRGRRRTRSARCSHSAPSVEANDLVDEAPESGRSRRATAAGRRAAPASAASEQLELVLERDRERVALARGPRTRPGRAARGPAPRRRTAGCARRQRERALERAPRRPRGGAAGGGEAPRAARRARARRSPRPRLRRAGRARRCEWRALVAGAHEARVGVVGAPGRRVHQLFEEIPHRLAGLQQVPHFPDRNRQRRQVVLPHADVGERFEAALGGGLGLHPVIDERVWPSSTSAPRSTSAVSARCRP